MFWEFVNKFENNGMEEIGQVPPTPDLFIVTLPAISLWGMSPGGHGWYYYPGTLSFFLSHQITAASL